jgi:hypothetical protein
MNDYHDTHDSAPLSANVVSPEATLADYNTPRIRALAVEQ